MSIWKKAFYINELQQDIVNYIKQYIYFDIHSKKYAKHISYKNRKNLHIINTMMSRKNGFYGFNNENTEVKHWVFGGLNTEKLNLQSINCRICGNYAFPIEYQINYSLCECNLFDDWIDDNGNVVIF